MITLGGKLKILCVATGFDAFGSCFGNLSNIHALSIASTNAREKK